MTLTYSRWSPRDVVTEVVAHVRAHLSSIADPDDDETAHAARVEIHTRDSDDGVLVTGELDAEPVAPYLRPDYDPEQEERP